MEILAGINHNNAKFKSKRNQDNNKIELTPKKTVSVLLNTNALRDLWVFIITKNNYHGIRYVDIIINKPV